MTGMSTLNLSAICWASLKFLGTTRCTSTRAGRMGSTARTEERTGARRLLAEDVVVLGAAARAARQLAHIGPFLVRALQLVLRSHGLFLVVLVLVGDAEVHQHLVPRIAQAHRFTTFKSEQDAPHAHDGRTFLHGDLDSRHSCPSIARRKYIGRATLPKAVALARGRERTRDVPAPGSSKSGGMHMRPANSTLSQALASSRKAATWSGLRPLLVSSPERLTSSSTRTGRFGARLYLPHDAHGPHRVDQAHDGQHQLGLAALQMTDEVPDERIAITPRAWRPDPGRDSRLPGGLPPRRALACARQARTWWPPGSRRARRAARRSAAAAATRSRTSA